MRRRERTRKLIELGGLVAKSGIVDLVDDDRAIIYGALLQAAAVLRSEDGDDAKRLWSRRGHRAFNDEPE
ncbi:conjugal transfer protein TraD [Sphingomonas spermidinifaciens]|uniref:conjugal transfer protein TraD n=1 Tax=Sphingomonas spermidinifaciens TaxID=1141889 RepID=UPI001C3E9A33|nr:conjugal transfer protein TraD [Sphingomonas spermidinifaciens]